LADAERERAKGGTAGVAGAASGGDVLAEVAAALGRAAETEEGRRVCAGHDEDYQFDLSDGPTFHASIEGGRLRVLSGPTPKTGYFETTFIDTDTQTLRALLAGRMGPIEAVEARRFNMVVRMYEGCQITILLRIAGEQGRADLLEAAWSRAGLGAPAT
jgi:hypothetical protein